MVTALAERRDDLAGLIGNLNDTTRALGSQKEALAESIGRLPPFMRRANTTFVDLRSTLNEVDPLVEASKPVAKRLQPFLAGSGLRRARSDGPRPRLTIRRRGRANDLINSAVVPPRRDRHRHERSATLPRPHVHRREPARLPGVSRPRQGRRRRDRLPRPYTTDSSAGSTTSPPPRRLRRPRATARHGLVRPGPPRLPGDETVPPCPVGRAPAKTAPTCFPGEQEALCAQEDRAVPREARARGLAVLGCARLVMLPWPRQGYRGGRQISSPRVGRVKGGDFRVGGVNAGQTPDSSWNKKKASRPRPL